MMGGGIFEIWYVFDFPERSNHVVVKRRNQEQAEEEHCKGKGEIPHESEKNRKGYDFEREHTNLPAGATAQSNVGGNEQLTGESRHLS